MLLSCTHWRIQGHGGGGGMDYAPKMPRPLVAILLCAFQFSAPLASRPNLAAPNLQTRSASACTDIVNYSRPVNCWVDG